MKKLLSTLAVVTALTTGAQAGAVLDLTVGGGALPSVTPAGKIDTFDLVTSLGIDKSAQSYMYFEVDHLIPIIPNFRYETSTLDFTGTASQVFTLGTVSFTASAASNLTFSNEDYIGYWGIPFSTWIPMIDVADFGIGVKMATFGFGIDGLTSESTALPIPYGYLRLHVSPPALFGIGFEFETKTISYSDSSGASASFMENIFKADWSIEAPIPVLDLEVGVELGYKTTTLDIAAGTFAVDFGFSGVFFGAFAHFGI